MDREDNSEKETPHSIRLHAPRARKKCKLCKFRPFYNPKNTAGVVFY